MSGPACTRWRGGSTLTLASQIVGDSTLVLACGNQPQNVMYRRPKEEEHGLHNGIVVNVPHWGTFTTHGRTTAEALVSK